MPRLLDEVRHARRIQFNGRWAASAAFRTKRQGLCEGCDRPIREGDWACFARWEGLGSDSRLVHHPDCVQRLPRMA